MQQLRAWRQCSIRDRLFLTAYILGIVFFRVIYMIRIVGPFIYADEFGYWSHAAHMTGHTWAGAMGGVSWYSFGYSFWLALTFFFSDEMAVMYRLALGFNVLMSVGIYLLVYRIVRKLAKEQTVGICGLIAFVTTCFPTYIFYSYTTMCETLAALVVWILFYEMISLEEKPVWWKGILLGVTAGYAFMVHNRLLTVVFAVALCLAVLWFRHKIDGKTILSFVLSLAVMMFLFVIMRDFLKGMITENQVAAEKQLTVAMGSGNTFQAIWNRIVGLFRPERIKRPFLSLMGQLWQCLSASYLLIGLGTIYAVRHMAESLKEKQNFSIYLYPLTAVLFSVGLTAIAAYGPERGAVGRIRIDPAFYGRYNECFFPLLVMMALILLCEAKLRSVLKMCAGVAVLYLALCGGMYYWLYGIDGYLNIVSAVSIHIFHWLGEFGVWKCGVIALLGSGAVVGLCCLKRFRGLGRYAGMLILAFLFTMTAVYCMRTTIRAAYDNTMQYMPLYEYLNENTAEGEVVYTTSENKAAYDLQSRLVNKPVFCIGAEQLADVPEGAYIVVKEEMLSTPELPDHEVCLEKNGYAVIKPIKK